MSAFSDAISALFNASSPDMEAAFAAADAGTLDGPRTKDFRRRNGVRPVHGCGWPLGEDDAGHWRCSNPSCTCGSVAARAAQDAGRLDVQPANGR